ncbi:hypothetical protein MSAN_01696500 [Mycena sanguinolenta]|uniref:Uncharacterized protein n=1 Tax=Mycena sanguinolenta TaxID=230812 RepID=A0A8H6XZ07_9AGAR|nr:hypothetical protein MSAN_01696500 [Mycena sanguinolenta]
MRTRHGTLSSVHPSAQLFYSSCLAHPSSHVPSLPWYWDSKPPTALASIVQALHVRPSPPTGWSARGGMMGAIEGSTRASSMVQGPSRVGGTTRLTCGPA